MTIHRNPPLFFSTMIVVGLTAAWGYVRLVVFHDTAIPLTFVLPLLVCVWSRQRWQLWGMAAAFMAMTIVKAGQLAELQVAVLPTEWFFITTIFNITLGAIVVHLILAFRDRSEANQARVIAQNAELELQAEQLQQQNTELEEQAEELAQQNEEIKTQSEELAQQYEEIEAQSEELTQQNEELTESNQRLRSREDLLQAMFESSRAPEARAEGLAGICGRALAVMGLPAEAVVVLERAGEHLEVRAQAGSEQLIPARWPLAGSLARVVVDADKTAYVSHLATEPQLNAPFGADHAVQSVLATPLRIAGRCEGVVAVCSTSASHWSTEHFRLLEWFSAQCGLILEAHRWQIALQRHAREAEAANQAKDRFLAMLSHELRTPLTPVLAAAGAMANDASVPEHVREELGMIRRNVSIQNRLIDDLLDLTRISRGKLMLERERLSLHALVRSALEITAPDLDARDQRLTLDLAALDGCALDGDGARLQQVFWNLLKNAVKFSPPGTAISITTERLGDRVRIRVQDRGVGLASGDLERIFQPFEQVRGDGRGADAGGLGLGLAIARTIVELHHGSLRAESGGHGQGATFIVELPVLPGAHSSRPATASPVEPAAQAPIALRILLTEDHADTARVMGRLLRGAGHAVQTATTATEALALFSPGKFDLLMSDLGLPDLDGCEVMRRIRELDPAIPGVCMSGYGTEKDVERTRAAGFTEHLTKPVDVQQLHAAVARTAQVVQARRNGG
jgi:CheY-like chemotaxis protein/nitrogen-specific signal transduction histidine kinase